VDIANKTGASLQITFRRASAATDTIRVFYALGGSSRSYSVILNGTVVGTPTFPSTGSWTAWSSLAITVPMQDGINRLKFAATTNTSDNANLDCIVVGGQTATPVYKLLLTKSGAGSVAANPASADSFYDAGTSVTLTATPAGGSGFYRWSGTSAGASNPHNIVMNAHHVMIGVMPVNPGFGAFPFEATPRGFASVGAFIYPSGTTGGSGPGSHAVFVTSSDELGALMLRRVDATRVLDFPPLVVYVIGTLTPGSLVTDMCDVKDVYDISLIGVGVDATLSGFGLNIVRSQNIIVRNLRIQNAPVDGVTVQADDVEGTGNHIWLDHNTITNCGDGALDVTHTASYVTVSWNHFHHHDKLCLMGHSDGQSSDVAMKVSYHHNYFDSTGQRHPRVRYGKAHVFNNYYRKTSLYGVSSNLEADVLMEGNYFLNVPLPSDTSRDGSPPGDVVERSNIYVNSGLPQTRGSAFEASTFYQYALDDPATLPVSLASFSGSGRWDFSASADPPPSPPGMPLLFSPANGHSGVPVSQTLVWRTTPTSVNYRVQCSVDSTFASAPMLDSTLTDTVCSVPGLQYSTRYFWRVRASNESGPGPFSLPWSFQTSGTTVSLQVPLVSGWNMISNPVTNPVPGDSLRQLHPTSVNPYAFEFNGGYVQRYTLENGRGYWAKFPAPVVDTISGQVRAQDSIAVVAGWNIVGSISCPVDVNTIVSVPDGLRASNWFGYDGAYGVATQIVPGKAYWVKSHATGLFILSCP
jgi:pectate lyase